MTAVNARRRGEKDKRKKKLQSSPCEGWGKVSARAVTVGQSSTALIDVMVVMMELEKQAEFQYNYN